MSETTQLYEIKSWATGAVLFSGEYQSFRACVANFFDGCGLPQQLNRPGRCAVGPRNFAKGSHDMRVRRNDPVTKTEAPLLAWLIIVAALTAGALLVRLMIREVFL